MRGGAGAEAGMEAEQHQPAPSGHHLQQSTAPKSPPLSAAPSQASLSGSDRTPSDPELMSRASSSVSLASTSRPASASPAPHLATDITRAVEEEDEDAIISNGYPSHTGSVTPQTDGPASHTESPVPHTNGPAPPTDSHIPQTNGSAPHTAAGANRLLSPVDEPLIIPDLDDPDGPDSFSGLNSRDGNNFLRVENGMDGPSSDVEEEYFEEYHLPNTHENAFVRHLSFRRKVEGTPINAPDAEKIEGLVRTGEYERHGSMRRKIVPAPEILYRLEEDSPSDDGRRARGPKQPQVQEFGDDFREIEKMMDGDGGEEEEGDYEVNGGDQLRFDDEGNAINPKFNVVNTDTPKLLMRGKNAFTSTPNAPYASTADYASIDLSVSLHDNTGSRRESSGELLEPESLSIEQSTLTKVKECMDFSKCKDIYSLTGKLQDMLTAVEVEEVLNNSHRYTDVIDTGILEALFNTVSEQMSMSGQPMSISFNKSDPKKPVQEKKVMTKEEVELQKKIKQKLLMEELAMDSLPYMSVQPGEERRDEPIPEEVIEEEAPVVVMRQKKGSVDGSDGEGSRYSTIERRKSVRVSAGQSQMEVEGVFIESDFKDSKLKTIPAPTIDLMNTQDDLDLPDMEETRSWSADDEQEAGEEGKSERGERRNSLAPPFVGDDGSFEMSVPSIRITRTESSREHDDNSSVNNLYVDEATDASSLYCVEDDSIKVCRPADEEYSVDDLADDDGFEHVSPDPQPFAEAEGLGAPAPPAELEGPTEEERHFRSVVIGGVWRRIDMKVIAPYQKCISAGGEHSGFPVIVVSACCLPERSRVDYSYVMDNLFLYLLSRLEQLVAAEDYILVYLSGGRNVAQTGPGFHWLKAAYRMIDRKLRKNLQALLVVHPTLWVRTVVALTRPFISSKFYRKLTFVYSLTELAQLIPLHQLQIPESVQQADFELMIREKKRNVSRRPRPPGFGR